MKLRSTMMIGVAVFALAACNTDGGAAPEPELPVVEIVPDADESQAAAPAALGQTDGYNADRNAYFGDLHIHTKNSFDAYIFNVRNTPDDVYKFAKGETIRHPAGFPMKIWGEPLDFVAATDHAAYLGILPAMNTPGHPLNELEMAQDMFSTEPEKITNAFQTIGNSVRTGEAIDGALDMAVVEFAWAENLKAAEDHYEPGKLTTFAAYEFTSVKTSREVEGSFAGGNLHRNVVFRDEAPDRPFSVLDSPNPEDLWDWMDRQRAAGRDAIAIPHNSNVSDGLMFDTVTYDGNPLDMAYAAQRMKNEPIVEITQVKGTSETHPELSPNDEWADFEIYEALLGGQIRSKISGGFVREALARGLGMQAEQGFNPYKFGIMASSDTHVAGGAFDEKDYWSKVGIVDATPEDRGSVPLNGAKTWGEDSMTENADYWFSKWGAAGLAGVWAEENTRESIHDAMRRKETFATSGPRMKVRFFAGHGLDEALLGDAALVSKAYASGVTMGGEIAARGGQAPAFIAWAVRDPLSAPLQRLQIVKVWHSDGAPQEMVYDAACSDGGAVDPATHRCPENGARVDLSDCSFSQDKGAAELRTVWRDPDYQAGQRASYYVRVLENPSCRWSTWDALKAGVPPNPKLQPTLQERAWSSPIWVTGAP